MRCVIAFHGCLSRQTALDTSSSHPCTELHDLVTLHGSSTMFMPRLNMHVSTYQVDLPILNFSSWKVTFPQFPILIVLFVPDVTTRPFGHRIWKHFAPCPKIGFENYKKRTIPNCMIKTSHSPIFQIWNLDSFSTEQFLRFKTYLVRETYRTYTRIHISDLRFCLPNSGSFNFKILIWV